MSTFDLVEGQTAPVDAQLTNRSVVPDLTGSTPELVLKGSDGSTVTTSGKVAWIDATQAQIRFSPSAGDLLAAKSPYAARWKVTDGGGKIAYWPDDEPDRWVVRPVTV